MDLDDYQNYEQTFNDSQRFIDNTNDDYRADKIDMEKEEKKLPTIDIKGKQYVMVKDRVLAFNELYPNGSIATEASIVGDTVLFKATVCPDSKNKDRAFVGHSSASKGSQGIEGQRPVEVAETSAVGRALAFLGIGIIESVASADEIIVAQSEPTVRYDSTPSSNGSWEKEYASDKQMNLIEILCRNLKIGSNDKLELMQTLNIPLGEKLSKLSATNLIKTLKEKEEISKATSNSLWA